MVGAADFGHLPPSPGRTKTGLRQSNIALDFFPSWLGGIHKVAGPHKVLAWKMFGNFLHPLKS